MKRLFRHACAMLAVLLVMSMFTVVNASVPYLCENISGTTYRVVTSKKVNAKIENA